MSDNNQDIIFNFCYELALRDATIRSAYRGDRDELKRNELIRGAVRDYIDLINDGKHPSAVTTINQIIDVCSKDSSVSSFTIGNAQKLTNMTAKYMFIGSYHSDKRELYTSCDCPIDNIIAKCIYLKCEEYKISILENAPEAVIKRQHIKNYFKYFGFSKVSSAEYSYIQGLIRQISNKEGICPLEFDFNYWSKWEEGVLNELMDKSDYQA